MPHVPQYLIQGAHSLSKSSTVYANYDVSSNPTTSQIAGSLTAALGGGRAGAFGGEFRPRAASAMVDQIQGELNSGRYTPKSYRRAACKAMTAGFGARRDESGWRTYDEDPHNPVLKMRGKESEAVLEAVIRNGFKGLTDPGRVSKSFSPAFAGAINGLNTMSPQALAMGQYTASLSKQIGKAIGKSFSLAAPLTSGFVPFDLMPFVRTIYPVYTPLRNKIPRVPGQGEFHRAKILASITGSLPGGLGTLQDDATSEFFGGAGFSAWPNQLPASGSQSAYDVIIPYKFFALTEATSWLAQFAGQGFDDIYGLASLVLLQEFMLCEEHDLIASSSQSLAQPTAPVATARAALSTETALTFTGTDLWIAVTAINFWGETAYNAGAVTEVTNATTGVSVVDVTINPVIGAQQYVIYVGTGTTAPVRQAMWKFTLNTQGGSIGGVKFTLQGAVPTTGSNPLAADSGTGSANRQESILSVISGLAYNGGAGPYPNVSSGYYNNKEAQQLTTDVVTNALQQMYNGPTGYLANPSEIQVSPTDATILAKSIRAAKDTAFQFRVQQSEMSGVTAGVAISNMVNPITRSSPEILVHPYFPQGTAFYMSYTLPQTQNNLGNVVENVMVQDYAQIGWPVIDATFRQSILRYGSFFAPAPQYLGASQGLQVSAIQPYS